MASVTRNLWRYKKLYTFSWPIQGAQSNPSPQSVPVELTKYAQEDVFNRIVIHVTGPVVVAGSGAGTATGLDNPEGLLTQMILQTTPQVTGITPVNRLSGRGLLYENMIERGYLLKATAVPDAAGTYQVDYHYIINFKRKARKGIEYDFAIEKYTSALLSMVLGGRGQLFSGGTNTWNLGGLNVEIYADSNFGIDPAKVSLHSHELFENTYPITATQSDFPIDTLPAGYLYTDLIFLTEQNNILANFDNTVTTALLVSNFDIEGGGRVWLASGDNNADIVQSDWTQELLETGQTLTGIYVPVSLRREKLYSRMIDALLAPITLKLTVQGPAAGNTTTVRLIGRRMVPDAVHQSVPAKARAASPQNTPNAG
jgi:hypothetical protein